MKAVILAGGYGTRLSEYTKLVPKPMVQIKNKPIICHIMDIYVTQNINEFYFALGYKQAVLKKYFLNKFKIIKKINTYKFIFLYKIKKNQYHITINFINTGLNTMTGGRLKKISKYIDEENFFLTYGDGLANINLKKLYKLHLKQKKLVTISAVMPPARFGALKLSRNKVISFNEKPQFHKSWINGGFFVINKKFVNYIKSSLTYLEKYPLEKAAINSQLGAYKHLGFWKCMDTLRDKEELEKMIKDNKKLPWLND